MRERLSYANVMATIAVVLTVAGGTAYAANQLVAKNSVGTKQLRKGAVTGVKVKDRSLRGVDINLGALGTVPSAREANHADAADTATRAGNADAAHRATSAANADALGGIGPAGYLASSDLLRFSAAMDEGDADAVLGSLGPLTFIASCGEAASETDARIRVKTSAGPVFANGVELHPGGVRELAITTSNDSDEYTAELVTVASIVEAFAGGGAFTSIVNTTGADCRFVGHLLKDSG